MERKSKKSTKAKKLAKKLTMQKIEEKEPKLEVEKSFKNGRWTPKEDELLRNAVELLGEKKWKEVSLLVSGRNSLQCLHRWTKILRPGVVKGIWTPQENELLRGWVRLNGPTKWSECAKEIPGRSGKQCREHWFNKLDPEVKKGNWTVEEDEKIFRLYQKYGTSWSKIEKNLPGRTENAIKNRFYSALRRLESQGNKKVKKEVELIDPLENRKSVDAKLTAVDSGITTVSGVNSHAPHKTNLPNSSDLHGDDEYIQPYASINGRSEAVQNTNLTPSLQKIPEVGVVGQKQNGFLEKARDSCKENTLFENFLTKIEDSLTPEYFKKELQEDNEPFESDVEIESFHENLVMLGTNQIKGLDFNLLDGNLVLPNGLHQNTSGYTSTSLEQKSIISHPQQSDELFPSISEMYQMINNLMTESPLANEEKLISLFKQTKKFEEMLETTKNDFLSQHNKPQKNAKAEENVYVPQYDDGPFSDDRFPQPENFSRNSYY